MITTKMPTKHTASRRVSSFLLIASLITGCAANGHPAPVAGLAAYELNNLDAYDEVSMEAAWNATLTAIDRLGFIVIQ
jgi:hypothetical protein